MEEKKSLVKEKRNWKEPSIQLLSIEKETLGDGSSLSDTLEGES